MTNELKVDGKCQSRAGEMAQGLLGTPMDRPEGPLKVTGRATYAAEDLPEGCAHGVLVRAAGQGAVSLRNADAVEQMAGVLAVISDVFEHPSPAGRAAAYRTLFERRSRHRDDQ